MRAANTGISAVIDPYGHILKAVPLEETGVIDMALPRPLPPTFYTKYQESFFAFAVFILILAALIPRSRELGHENAT